VPYCFLFLLCYITVNLLGFNSAFKGDNSEKFMFFCTVHRDIQLCNANFQLGNVNIQLCNANIQLCNVNIQLCNANIQLCNANQQNTHFPNHCFNPILLVFYIFRTSIFDD